MATSSKVQFKLDVLKSKALEAIDFRIAQKEAELSSFADDEALRALVEQWRENQHEKLRDVVAAIDSGQLDDYRLSKFALDPIPSVDRYERQRAERDLRALESERTRIVAKSESLVPDADGNIGLTKLQLREFFGL